MDATTRPGPVMADHNWSGYMGGLLHEIFRRVKSSDATISKPWMCYSNYIRCIETV